VHAAARAGRSRAGWGGAGRPAHQQACHMGSPGGPPRPLRRRSGSACCARRGSGGAAAMAGPRGHLTGRGLQRYNTSVDRRRRPPASLDGRAHFVSMHTMLNKTPQAYLNHTLGYPPWDLCPSDNTRAFFGVTTHEISLPKPERHLIRSGPSWRLLLPVGAIWRALKGLGREEVHLRRAKQARREDRERRRYSISTSTAARGFCGRVGLRAGRRGAPPPPASGAVEAPAGAVLYV